MFGVASDDGSNLYIDNKKVVSNDGAHGYRTRRGTVKKMAAGQHLLRLEFFERGGHAGISLKYKGADTKSRGRGYVAVPQKVVFYKPQRGFKEEIFYLKAKDIGKTMPNLNRKNADAQRIIPYVEYRSTKSKWNGFKAADNFAARWSGVLFIRQKGADSLTRSGC